MGLPNDLLDPLTVPAAEKRSGPANAVIANGVTYNEPNSVFGYRYQLGRAWEYVRYGLSTDVTRTSRMGTVDASSQQ